MHFFVDYHHLNAHTVRNQFPMPRTNDSVSSLAGSMVFTSLDLGSRYWQLRKGDEKYGKNRLCNPVGTLGMASDAYGPQ